MHVAFLAKYQVGASTKKLKTGMASSSTATKRGVLRDPDFQNARVAAGVKSGTPPSLDQTLDDLTAAGHVSSTPTQATYTTVI